LLLKVKGNNEKYEFNLVNLKNNKVFLFNLYDKSNKNRNEIEMILKKLSIIMGVKHKIIDLP